MYHSQPMLLLSPEEHFFLYCCCPFDYFQDTGRSLHRDQSSPNASPEMRPCPVSVGVSAPVGWKIDDKYGTSREMRLEPRTGDIPKGSLRLRKVSLAICSFVDSQETLLCIAGILLFSPTSLFLACQSLLTQVKRTRRLAVLAAAKPFGASHDGALCW